MTIENFGRNVRFTPAEFFEPAGEPELLDYLNRTQPHAIRVVGSRHAWSPLIQTDGLLVSLAKLQSVQVQRREDGSISAQVGAGCQIKSILTALNRQNLTLPSLGLISEQRIAGAIATGTHGSGRNSLSHYVEGVRLVYFDAAAGRWVPTTIDTGDELRAARCSLGMLGIVTSVTMACRPQYYVDELWTRYDSIDEVLAQIERYPLQQFYLLPHRWDYIAQQRRVDEVATRRGALAWLYRWYFHLTFDIGMHLGILVTARWLRSPRLTRLLCQMLPAFVLRNCPVRDRSDLQLIMEHELFRHLETEIFVPESQVGAAARYVAAVLRVADGTAIDVCSDFRERLEATGDWPRLAELRGRHTHHYPICFRRILPDDTLLSMTAGSDEPWQSISLITYVEPRDDFYAVAQFLARTMLPLFGARVHWGKHVPVSPGAAAATYATIDRFRAVVARYDPAGRMQNAFTRECLAPAHCEESTAAAAATRRTLCLPVESPYSG
jgi:FAD/FMN-containing dehydrogenase